MFDDDDGGGVCKLPGVVRIFFETALVFDCNLFETGRTGLIGLTV
jgi:hypothetical protein